METYGQVLKVFPNGDDKAPVRVAYYTTEIMGLDNGALQILKDSYYLEYSSVLSYLWKDAVMWGTYATVFAAKIIARHRTDPNWLEQTLGVLTEQDIPLLEPESSFVAPTTTRRCGLVGYLDTPYWITSNESSKDAIVDTKGEPLLLTTNGLKVVNKASLISLRTKLLIDGEYPIIYHGQRTYRLLWDDWGRVWQKVMAEK